MVVMQPFLKLTGDPFRCEPRHKAEQLAALERTLTIAKAADHGAEKTHFTVIPEYSIPGPEGIALVEGILRDRRWPSGTVVIGCTDALSKDDYAALCDGNGTSVAPPNMPCKVQNDEWINCCITWVKVAADDLRRWLQPKIAPAWPEENIHHQSMFRGDSVFVFRSAFEDGMACRFFSLVCKDWIAAPNGQLILREVLDSINTQGKRQVTPLSWVFVPQRNSEPCSASFLSRTADFFQNQTEAPFVHRHDCCVVFANSAGLDKPGRATDYGYSSIIFSPRSPFDLKGCHLTYSGSPRTLRGSDALDQCRDVLFRERGACIHSFSHHLPGAIGLGAAGHSLPLRRALVHPIAPELKDPRTPGAPVPASVKWVNDSLDVVPCLSQQIPDASLAGSIGIPHKANIDDFRTVESIHLENDINWATWRPPKSNKGDGDNSPSKDIPPTADEWGHDQVAGLEHIVHTLDILRMGGSELNLANAHGHATATLRGQSVEVLAVNGPSHEKCEEHARQRFVLPRRRQVLFVTRDPQNAPRLRRDKSIVRVNPEPRLGQEIAITDPETGEIPIAFRDLMDIYIAAPDGVALEGTLYARLKS
jgi:hypothetical protein